MLFLRAFKVAFKGILYGIKNERNFRFHICAAVYVYFFSVFYSFTATEYAIITIAVGGVLAFELVNSSIELITDKISPEFNRVAALIKDMAAGAVLLFSIAAAVCGVLLFWDINIFQNIFVFFKERIWAIIILIISLIVSYVFVFLLFKRKSKG